MSNYKLIWSEEQIKQFFDFIPSLQENEVHALAMFARHKYRHSSDGALKTNVKDSCIDRRFFRYKDPVEMYVNLIKRYEVPEGCYTDKNGIALPNHVMAIYGSVNPRSGKKGAKELYVELMESFMDNRTFNYSNIDSRARNKLQKNAARKVFLDIDIDEKDEAILHTVLQFFQGELRKVEQMILETRGGWHMLINIKDLGKQMAKWKPELDTYLLKNNLAHKVEVKTDTLCPIPGTKQGGFDVRIISV